MFKKILILILISPLPLLADANKGREFYERSCVGCHSVDMNRVGPRHEGVYGRTAGSLKDFEYSTALKKSKIVWNSKNLNLWLKNPNKFIPENKMGYRITNEDSRKHIIDYLKSLK